MFHLLGCGFDIMEEEPMYFENFDLQTVVTPVNVDRFIQALKQTGFDSEKTQFLEKGLRFGFDIGYEGPLIRQSRSENIPFTVGNKTILWNKIMKEVKLKRVAGPYCEEEIPFQNFIQSPVGLVPKVGGDQTRLIFHLSYDFKDGLRSVNHYTPKEKCSVTYKDLDYTVRVYLKMSESESTEDLPTKHENRHMLQQK